jgi:phosphatidylglycerophosphate synthase
MIAGIDAAAKNRRPLASRTSGLAQALTRLLLRTSVTPNQISVASILFAALGAAALLAGQWHAGFLVLAAMFIQLRLLCNLLDGMMAIEGGRRSPTGALFNEVPDRIADTVLILALGFAVDAFWPGWAWLGWAGALGAVLTAYLRLLGGSLGLEQDFRGPMAKQHRMAMLTAGCLCGIGETSLTDTHYGLFATAILIAAGTFLTCAARLR